MRSFKGIVALLVIFGIALAIGGLLFFIGSKYTKIFFSSYEEDVLMTVKIDDMGSELMAVLTAGDSEMSYMEFLGSTAPKITDGKSEELEKTLKSISEAMKENYNLEVVFPVKYSDDNIKSYGPNPPEKTDLIKAEIPLPCVSNGGCKGEVRLRKW